MPPSAGWLSCCLYDILIFGCYHLKRWAASHFHRKVVKCMDIFQLMTFLGFCYTVYRIGYAHGYRNARKNRPGSGK